MELHYYIFVDGWKRVTFAEYEAFEGKKKFMPPPLNYAVSYILA
jgi:hypothetical protein